MPNLCFFASGGIYGSRNAFRSVRGTKHRRTIFMLGWDWYEFDKKHWDTLRRTCVFASGGIYGSHSAFGCGQGMKCRCTIFHAMVGWYGIYKKRARTRYTELVFPHLVGSVGHVVYSSASGA
jgi:hypothetical protein